jgi:hypothetical protein
VGRIGAGGPLRARKEMNRQQGFSPRRLGIRRFCAGAGKFLVSRFSRIIPVAVADARRNRIIAVSVGERWFVRRAGLVFHGERLADRTGEVIEPEPLFSRDDALRGNAGNGRIWGAISPRTATAGHRTDRGAEAEPSRAQSSNAAALRAAVRRRTHGVYHVRL